MEPFDFFFFHWGYYILLCNSVLLWSSASVLQTETLQNCICLSSGLGASRKCMSCSVNCTALGRQLRLGYYSLWISPFDRWMAQLEPPWFSCFFPSNIMRNPMKKKTGHGFNFSISYTEPCAFSSLWVGLIKPVIMHLHFHEHFQEGSSCKMNNCSSNIQ